MVVFRPAELSHPIKIRAKVKEASTLLRMIVHECIKKFSGPVMWL